MKPLVWAVVCSEKALMEYFFHFLKFLGVFALIIAGSLFALQTVSGGIL